MRNIGMPVAVTVERNMMPEPNSGCWLWTGYINHHGYGRFKLGRKVEKLAHRASYEAFVGPIPPRMVIDHLCRVRSCVNPDHLEAVGNVKNVMRGNSVFAHKARQTHCVRGHELSGENLRFNRPNSRRCMTCDGMRRLKYKRDAQIGRALRFAAEDL